MKRARFLISSLALAGFEKGEASLPAEVTPGLTGTDDPNQPPAVKPFRLDHLYTLASHSSHSSHASHASHSSGSGGGYYRAPVYEAPTTALPAYRAPAVAAPQQLVSPTPLRGRTELFNQIVKKVQLGLQAYGYYHGPIDGVVGPTMKGALGRFQGDYKLKVTRTITPEVLDTLRVEAR